MDVLLVVRTTGLFYGYMLLLKELSKSEHEKKREILPYFYLGTRGTDALITSSPIYSTEVRHSRSLIFQLWLATKMPLSVLGLVAGICGPIPIAGHCQPLNFKDSKFDPISLKLSYNSFGCGAPLGENNR